MSRNSNPSSSRRPATPSPGSTRRWPPIQNQTLACDHLCIGPRVFDLAYYAVHHLKWVTDDATATGRWLTNLPYLLTGYCSRQRLSPAEMSALPSAMMAYHLLLAAWFGSRAQFEPIAREVRALDWLDRHFDAVVTATTSAVEQP